MIQLKIKHSTDTWRVLANVTELRRCPFPQLVGRVHFLYFMVALVMKTFYDVETVAQELTIVHFELLIYKLFTNPYMIKYIIMNTGFPSAKLKVYAQGIFICTCMIYCIFFFLETSYYL